MSLLRLCSDSPPINRRQIDSAAPVLARTIERLIKVSAKASRRLAALTAERLNAHAETPVC